jgi:transcriptional regulator with XRE-family HTH domain
VNRKKMSQDEIEKPTGLVRCYISRVENGHTVPSLETLEKMAGALEVPAYRLFTDDAHVKKPNIPLQDIPSQAATTKEDRKIQALAKLFSRMNDKSLGLFVSHGVENGEPSKEVVIANAAGPPNVGQLSHNSG